MIGIVIILIGLIVFGFSLLDGWESFWGFVVSKVFDEFFFGLSWLVFLLVMLNVVLVDFEDVIK